MKNFKNILMITALVLFFAGCGKTKVADSKMADESRIEQVQTSPLKKVTVSRELELSTTLQGYETMNVAPSLNGKIEQIFVEVGSNVSRGQLDRKSTRLNSSHL